MSQEIINMTGISKHFGGVRALDNVCFACRKGEVHVLAGENGAGKSTILKMLAGIHQPDAGEITWQGKTVHIKTPQKAEKLGIAMVFQELTLVREMTVAENVYLHIEPCNRLGLINRKEMRRRVEAMMERYGIYLDPETLVRNLPVAQQQMAEILKILVRDPELIILDEPTSALAKKEVEQLYQIIRNLTALGKTIIFISHRLEEVFAIGDRVTIFKDGQYVDTRNIADINEDELIRLMVGRSLQSTFPPKATDIAQENLFEVQGLCAPEKRLRDVSFQVRRGEILGIAGLQGHGQSELLNALSGLAPVNGGEVLLRGQPVRSQNAAQAIRNGIALVPADRKNQGLMLELPIRHNLAIASMNRRKKGPFIDNRAEKQFAGELVAKLSIKIAGLDKPVNSLSGGNQQKVVLGKELAIEPKVMLFDEPTRGIDVEAKREFYNIMRGLAAQGVAVIMNSSDLMEVIGMSDRVLVMYEGAVSGVLSGADINEETIMRYAMGLGGNLEEMGERV